MSLSQSPPTPSGSQVPIYNPGPLINRKSLFLCGETIHSLFRKHPPSQVLFVTLTFPTKTRRIRNAKDHLDSLLNQIRKRYRGYVWVLHTHNDGFIHYHLLLPVTYDTHEDTDLTVWRFRDHYSDQFRLLAMNARLREDADWFETKAAAYGFGRVEVAPVYSNGDGVAKYLTDTDWRFESWPFEERQRIRFWGSSKNFKGGSIKFSWNTPKARLWRLALAAWAGERGCTRYEDLPRVIGRSWGWQFLTYYKDLGEDGLSRLAPAPPLGLCSSRGDFLSLSFVPPPRAANFFPKEPAA